MFNHKRSVTPNPARLVLWPLVAVLFVVSMVLYKAFMITQAVCDDLITWGESR